MSSLEAAGLQCTRGERTLFAHLSFKLGGGELLRVAGANGSGKTSLLRIASGLLEPTAGEVLWDGRNVRWLQEEFWKRLVYIGHASAVKDDLTATENLGIACTLAGVRARPEEIGEALRGLGLGGCENLPARVLSQGQRRRVALARLALSGAASLWILDEPFAALDAAAVERVQTLIAEHLARGASVILTTHLEVRIASAATQRIDLGGS